ncbi:hypothetical protein B0H11DRAFT_1663691, partial [Mycena galericulata]
PVLDLLCQHAPRWRDVYFWVANGSIPLSIGVKGNVPHLEKLSLPRGRVESMDVFEVAPRLTRLEFLGRAGANIPKLPWGQLQSF